MANIDDLASLIAQELESYSADVDEAMQAEIEKLGKDVVQELKSNSTVPQRTQGEKAYKKRFYLKKIAQGQGFKRVLVANKKYQLTHLLEYGHVNRDGGRARAFPHWQTAQKTVETLPERIRKALEK